MRRIYLALFLVLAATVTTVAQENKQQDQELRPATIGFSATFNDFTTARAIRNSSVASVINNKRGAKFREMSPGFGVMYAKGLRPKIDFAAAANFTIGDVVLRNKPDQTLGSTAAIDVDASAQFKMFPESFRVIPYLSAGAGLSIAQGYYGAILPLGVGMRFRISDEFSVGLQSQYRVAVTETAGYHFQHGFTVMGKL